MMLHDPRLETTNNERDHPCAERVVFEGQNFRREKFSRIRQRQIIAGKIFPDSIAILQVSGLNYRERLLLLELLPLSMWLELQDILFLVRNLKNPSDNFTILDYVNFRKSNTRSSTKTLGLQLY